MALRDYFGDLVLSLCLEGIRFKGCDGKFLFLSLVKSSAWLSIWLDSDQEGSMGGEGVVS